MHIKIPPELSHDIISHRAQLCSLHRAAHAPVVHGHEQQSSCGHSPCNSSPHCQEHWRADGDIHAITFQGTTVSARRVIVPTLSTHYV